MFIIVAGESFASDIEIRHTLISMHLDTFQSENTPQMKYR